jgi:putative ABC transport system ATP-binding protein
VLLRDAPEHALNNPAVMTDYPAQKGTSQGQATRSPYTHECGSAVGAQPQPQSQPSAREETVNLDPTEEQTPIIELRGVTKRFETPAGTVVALDRADLSVEAAQLVVVLGPSGSGKTTLLNMIGALDTPTEGSIEVAGKRVTDLSRPQLFGFRRQTVTFIFQAFNLFPELTALENVRFGAEVSGHRSAAEFAVRMLQDVDLGDRVQHFPHELSGGEQQRVAIARSLATGNPVLLADEPTGELDFRTGIQILQLLRDRTNDGKTVVVVTHNREISRMADVVVELSDGRIVSSAPPPGGPVDATELRW